jgi:hypothetical protein
MRIRMTKAFEARKLSLVKAHKSFGALGNMQLRSAGAGKLLADDRSADEGNTLQDWLDLEAPSRAVDLRDADELLVLIGRRGAPVGECLIARSVSQSDERANQSPEPTVMLVTPRAGARVAPSTTVAHL